MHDKEEHGMDSFILETRDAFEEIDAVLMEFSQNNFDDALLRDVTCRVHSLVTNLQLSGYVTEAEYAHRVAIVLEQIDETNLPFNEASVDVLMVAVEYLRFIIEAAFKDHAILSQAILHRQNALERFTGCLREEFLAVYQETLDVFDKGYVVCVEQEEITPRDIYPKAIEESRQEKVVPLHSNGHQSGDLEYFHDLMLRAEDCHPDWQGRGRMLLRIALEMNLEAGSPIDEQQLEAAVYMHDFGMSFIPASPLNKAGQLSEGERRKMQEHPLLGAELLFRMKGWDEAAKMVMQHHEREDGKGYPEAVSGDSICDGARILAIVDTIYAMTNKSSYRNFRKPLLRAVTEINNCSGSQFSPKWVEIFNRVVKRTKGSLIGMGHS